MTGAAVKAPRRTQKERRETTIKRLIDATIESLLAVGYARTTVKEICRRADLSHGALFRFFPTVLDLVLAASEEVGKRQIAEFGERFAHAGGSSDPLVTAVSLLRDACRSETNTVFYELLVAARTDPELRAALQEPMQRYYAAIREAAEQVPGIEDIPPEIFETLLFTAIHLFDGESLSRAILPRPDLEARRLELVVMLLASARR